MPKHTIFLQQICFALIVLLYGLDLVASFYVSRHVPSTNASSESSSAASKAHIPAGMALKSSDALWIINRTDDTVVSATLPPGTAKHIRFDANVRISGFNDSPTALLASVHKFSIVVNNQSVPTELLIATAGGKLFAWNRALNNSAQLVADLSSSQPDNQQPRRSGSSIAGLASATLINGSTRLFATNPPYGVVEVFDESFRHLPSLSFSDQNVPSSYAPFGIQTIRNRLYVTFVHKNESLRVGPGRGYVSVFDSSGQLVQSMLIRRGYLNYPYGIAVGSCSFAEFSDSLLIGNRGDGTIHAYDLTTGLFKGTLRDCYGRAIIDPNLWALTFLREHTNNRNQLLFSTDTTIGSLYPAVFEPLPEANSGYNIAVEPPFVETESFNQHGEPIPLGATNSTRLPECRAQIITSSASSSSSSAQTRISANGGESSANANARSSSFVEAHIILSGNCGRYDVYVSSQSSSQASASSLSGAQPPAPPPAASEELVKQTQQELRQQEQRTKELERQSQEAAAKSRSAEEDRKRSEEEKTKGQQQQEAQQKEETQKRAGEQEDKRRQEGSAKQGQQAEQREKQEQSQKVSSEEIGKSQQEESTKQEQSEQSQRQEESEKAASEAANKSQQQEESSSKQQQQQQQQAAEEKQKQKAEEKEKKKKEQAEKAQMREEQREKEKQSRDEAKTKQEQGKEEEKQKKDEQKIKGKGQGKQSAGSNGQGRGNSDGTGKDKGGGRGKGKGNGKGRD